jgi:hypothetical protein
MAVKLGLSLSLRGKKEAMDLTVSNGRMEKIT